MNKEACVTCGKTKTILNCGVCTISVCKTCAQIIDEETFSFSNEKKPEMMHLIFCNTCFDQHISSELVSYEQTMTAAKEVLIFFKSQGKETRLIRRLEDPVSVKDCPDYDETLMRLAFAAAKKGYNAVIDIDLSSKKLRIDSYQRQIYSATGVPAHVHVKDIIKDRSIWQNPN